MGFGVANVEPHLAMQPDLHVVVPHAAIPMLEPLQPVLVYLLGGPLAPPVILPRQLQFLLHPLVQTSRNVRLIKLTLVSLVWWHYRVLLLIAWLEPNFELTH